MTVSLWFSHETKPVIGRLVRHLGENVDNSRAVIEYDGLGAKRYCIGEIQPNGSYVFVRGYEPLRLPTTVREVNS